MWADRPLLLSDHAAVDAKRCSCITGSTWPLRIHRPCRGRKNRVSRCAREKPKTLREASPLCHRSQSDLDLDETVRGFAATATAMVCGSVPRVQSRSVLSGDDEPFLRDGANVRLRAPHKLGWALSVGRRLIVRRRLLRWRLRWGECEGVVDLGVASCLYAVLRASRV